MKITINNEVCHIGWQYKDKDQNNIPLTTICFIRNKEGKVLHEKSVKRFYRDAFDKESARKYSFKKVVDSITDDKNIKKYLWNTYLTRNQRLQINDPQDITRLRALLYQSKKALREIENTKLEEGVFNDSKELLAAIDKEFSK